MFTVDVKQQYNQQYNLNYWRELKFAIIVSGSIWYSSQLKSQEMALI